MSHLATLLAELAHDFTITAATGATRALSPQEVQALAETLRDCAGLARTQADAFARIVIERDQLLAVARDADLVVFARAGAPRPVVRSDAPNVVDLARFARSRRLEVTP